MTIADRIKLQREKLGLSQEELAHRMGLKSRSSITRIEKSGDDITMKDIERIAYYLDCSKLYLMGWDNNSKNEQEINREEHFVKQYKQLNEYQKTLVDNMIAALTEKK